MKRLEGKVAIVTGGASGQGKAEAKLFGREGAKVVVTDINYDGAKEVADAIKNDGGHAVAVKHDVSKEDDWTAVMDKAHEEFGKVSILVNNAGIGGAEGFAQMGDIDLDGWNKFININATSQFLGMKMVSEDMKEQEAGSIINISSIAGIVGGAAGVHYSSSKGAIRIMTKGAAVELAPYNVRVNSVHPGFIDTPMVSVVTEDEEATKDALKNIPMNRMAKPEEIATTVLFLASEESSYITGTEIIADGGFTAR